MGSRASFVEDSTTASIAVSEPSLVHAAAACAVSVSQPWHASSHCAEWQQQSYERGIGVGLGIVQDEGLAADSSAIEVVAGDVGGVGSYGFEDGYSLATRLGAAFEVVAAESPRQDESRHVVAGAADAEARAREEVGTHCCILERGDIGLDHSLRQPEGAFRYSSGVGSSRHWHRLEKPMLDLADHLAGDLATGSLHNGDSDCCGSSSQATV